MAGFINPTVTKRLVLGTPFFLCGIEKVMSQSIQLK